MIQRGKQHIPLHNNGRYDREQYFAENSLLMHFETNTLHTKAHSPTL